MSTLTITPDVSVNAYYTAYNNTVNTVFNIVASKPFSISPGTFLNVDCGISVSSAYNNATVPTWIVDSGDMTKTIIKLAYSPSIISEGRVILRFQNISGTVSGFKIGDILARIVTTTPTSCIVQAPTMTN